MKKLVKVVSSVVIALSFAGMGTQIADAATTNSSLASAEVMPTDPAIKKGQKIIVVVKDTKKQTVAVYNQKAQKTNKTVKMGSEYTAKAVKNVHGKKIVKVAGNKWLAAKDVTQD